MDKKILIVAGITATLIIGVAFWYFTNNPAEWARKRIDTKLALGMERKGENADNPPAQLSTDFDPSINRASFQVMSYEQSGQRIMMRYMFPESKAGEQVICKINCPEDDYQMRAGNSRSKAVTKQEFERAVENTGQEMVVVMGLCDNSNCGELVEGCYLHLTGVRAL